METSIQLSGFRIQLAKRLRIIGDHGIDQITKQQVTPNNIKALLFAQLEELGTKFLNINLTRLLKCLTDF